MSLRKRGPKPGTHHAGTFKKGSHGNPFGKPPMTPEQREWRNIAIARCRHAVPEVMDRVIEIAKHSENERNVLHAAEIVFERALGKPVQEIDFRGLERLDSEQFRELLLESARIDGLLPPGTVQ